MKTDDLIHILAQDAPVRARLDQLLMLALLIGTVVSIAIMVSSIGIRGDIESAMRSIRVLFKLGLTLVFSIAACRLVFAVAKPGLPSRPRVLFLLVPAALLFLGIGSELMNVPPDAWNASMMGHYSAFCLLFIPALSLAPLACFLWALKSGAPESPGRAGAAAGLAAGGIAAAIYAWHCPDDSPLFVATWYVIAISAVTLIGFLLGHRCLRW